MTPQPSETFPSLLERLYSERYTGPLVLHLSSGVPNAAEVPKPAEKIQLVRVKA